MRIGLIRRRYASGGGAEQTVARLAGEFAVRGHTVTVVAERWAAQLPVGVSQHVVRVLPGPEALRILTFGLRAVRAARGLTAEVVLSLDRTPGADVFRAGDGCHRAWLEARARALGFEARLREILNPLHRTTLWLERRLLEADDPPWVIANSRMVRADLLRHYRVPAERIAVIYNGVDPDRFRPPTAAQRESARNALNLAAGDVVLLLVGSGFVRKGVESVVRAAGIIRTRVPGTRVRVLVVGRGQPRPYLRVAREIGLPPDAVRFLGPVSDVGTVYHTSDVFVLPSLYDPCANVCIEAMAAGLPVVTSAANGAAELVEGTAADAILPDPLDVAGLADRLIPLLDADVRRTRGEAGRAVASGLSHQRMVEETALVCERARDERRSRAQG
ncbi:MAG: glycosyltransferase family 4 protein [Acidobacteria bacterium]|nr:glycosyltransferase family 4 protein [Acidobacteriota bacterium]